MSNNQGTPQVSEIRLLGFKLHLWHIVIGIYGLFTGLTFIIYEFVPLIRPLNIIKADKPTEVFLLTFLFMLLIGSVVIFFIYAHLKLWKSHLIFSAISFVLLIAIICLYIGLSVSREIPSGPIEIDQTVFTLCVRTNGSADVKRERLFTALDDLCELAETDFYSSGGLSKDSIKVWIKKSPGGESTHVDLVEFSLGRFVNKFPLDKCLETGQKYLMTTTLNAPGAYADNVSDAFQVEFIHKTYYFECKILFDSLRAIDPSSVVTKKIKDRGIPISSSSPLAVFKPTWIKLDNHTINFMYGEGGPSPTKTNKTNPKHPQTIERYDQYGVSWNYLPTNRGR